MPHVGILGTALTTHTTKMFGLFVGSTDVIRGVDAVPTFGTPIESIEVTENGPGGVSSMRFSVDDPELAVTLAPGMDVLFYDFTVGYPMFRGYAQRVSVRPSFGEQGRAFDVECIGIECLLDWAILPSDVTYAAGLDGSIVVMSVIAAATGTDGGLRASIDNATTNGNQAAPITPAGFGTLVAALTITAGTSLREALRLAITSCSSPSGTLHHEITVDFYRGLRIWRDDALIATPRPDDYVTEVFTNTPAGAPTHALEYSSDMGTTHAVFIKGANAAGTGFVSDGSGLPGQLAYLEDATVDSAALLQARGNAYLAEFRSGLRGEFQSDHPSQDRHPGTLASLTDARIGLAAMTYPIMSISKTFYRDEQWWTYSFGGIAPSMANLVRRLTRTIRS